MPVRTIVWVLIALTAVILSPCYVGAAAQQQEQQSKAAATPPPLSEAHKKWLEEEVVYIISDVEKKAFLQLHSDKERDDFINAFWLVRDPTPGTEKNEFKEEHYKRIEYANKKYGRDTAKPGWKTDRGRLHILMGEPRFKEEYPEDMLIQPTELWHYISVDVYGLPSSFYLIFWRPYGVGEMRLFSPTSDGINKLFRPLASLQGLSNEELTDKLFTDVDPELSHAVWSLLPSEGGLATDSFTPNPLASEMILARVYDARNYPQNYEWVDNYLKMGTAVKVDYTFLQSSPDALFTWIQNPMGQLEMHYAVLLKPDEFSLGRYQDRVYGSVTLDGFITSDDGKLLTPLREHSEFEVPEKQVNEVSRRPFELEGLLPIIPGSYQLSLMWKNEVSRRNMPVLGEIEVPDIEKLDKPILSPPVLILAATPVEEDKLDQVARPFMIGNTQFTPDICGIVPPGSMVKTFTQLILPPGVTLLVASYNLEFRFYQGDKEVHKEVVALSKYVLADALYTSTGIYQPIETTNLLSGDYTMRVALMAGSEEVALSKEMKFKVWSRELKDPFVIRRGLPPYTKGFHSTARAEQWLRRGDTQRAIEMLQDAVDKEPSMTDAKIVLMRLLLKAKEFDKILVLGENLLIERPRDIELVLLMASAYYGSGNDKDAIRLLERVLSEQPQNLSALNLIAHAKLASGDVQGALSAINRSLEILPEQKSLKEMKAQIEASIQQ
jgi:GWxTD domain-containing protein